MGLTLRDLKIRALGHMDETIEEGGHYGDLATHWINDALLKMYEDGPGVEAVDTIATRSGIRVYRLPFEIIRPYCVLWNGKELQYVPVRDQDFYNGGVLLTPGMTDNIDGSTADPTQYSLFGTSPRYIVLGPYPPGDPGTDEDLLHVLGHREPKMLVDEDEEPELPNRFRPYLSIYAAKHMVRADGSLGDVKDLNDEWEKGQKLFKEFLLYGSSDSNFTQVKAEYL